MIYDKNKPDIVLPKYNAVVFVNGCFWHGHNCHLFKWPKTRQEFWQSKIEKNQKNDASTLSQLRDMGWRVALVWECALKGKTKKNFNQVRQEIDQWLKSDEPVLVIIGK